MRLVGLISVLVGVGVIAQYILGLAMVFYGLYYLRDLHATAGIVGLILIAFLTYSSIRSGSPLLKIFSLLALLLTLSQVALGMHIYFSPSIIASDIHMILGVILIIVIAITGYISMKSSRSSISGR
ncbi:hypothetical protein ATG_18670 [Desulfurococcaceae archaeon AG1]|jgi:succinate dehydrogenase hydrophobic anchor subunit|nr:MAG: hypothetical protein DJ555_04945 [Desulfurococcaceae archaeon]GAY26663.1 hypothetical protein ATG_18670 [Desulfurococcaceae archaeon AG1]